MNKDLTIQEIFKAKQELERKIFDAMQKFEDITGCLITDINFTFIVDDEGSILNDQIANGVELDVRLNNEFFNDLNNKK